jgi:hypothetical protein
MYVYLCQKPPFVVACLKPRLRLGQKTQPRTKKMHFLALVHK